MRSKYAWYRPELGSLEDAELALGIELFWRRAAFLDCNNYSLGQCERSSLRAHITYL